MTENYGVGPSRPETGSTGQAVREQAANVGQGAAQAGGRVAQTAVEQGREVARETRVQARNLVNEATGELTHQTSMQQKRAAEGLRAVGSELHAMASRSEQGGLAGELVAQAADRAHQAANWLEHRQPGEVLDEVRAFARRHPGAFLAGALAAGMVVGRLTRNLADSSGMGGEAHPGDTYAETARVPAPPVATQPLPSTTNPGTTTYPGTTTHPGTTYQAASVSPTGMSTTATPYQEQP